MSRLVIILRESKSRVWQTRVISSSMCQRRSRYGANRSCTSDASRRRSSASLHSLNGKAEVADKLGMVTALEGLACLAAVQSVHAESGPTVGRVRSAPARDWDAAA